MMLLDHRGIAIRSYHHKIASAALKYSERALLKFAQPSKFQFPPTLYDQFGRTLPLSTAGQTIKFRRYNKFPGTQK